jgi:hypothetical protein
LAPSFSLSESLNCLNISKKVNKINNDVDKSINLNITLYTIINGLQEYREKVEKNKILKNRETLKDKFNVNPNYEFGKCPFKIKEEGKINYLSSKFYGINYILIIKKWKLKIIIFILLRNLQNYAMFYILV